MEKPWSGTVRLLFLAAFLATGCQPPPAKRIAPTLVANASPSLPDLSPIDPPVPEQTLTLPAKDPTKSKPSLHPPSAPAANSYNPDRASARRDPTARPPAAKPPRPEPPPPSSAPTQRKPASDVQTARQPEAAPPPPPPRFELPQPDYPTAAPKQDGGAIAAPSMSGQRLTAANGLGARPAQGTDQSELFLLDENAAYPTYHPAVVVDGWRDEQWLTVQFQISPNGRFRVALLDGTGDPVVDALALSTLRQWKWQPRKVKGRPVASTEVLRLKRKVTQGP